MSDPTLEPRALSKFYTKALKKVGNVRPVHSTVSRSTRGGEPVLDTVTVIEVTPKGQASTKIVIAMTVGAQSTGTARTEKGEIAAKTTATPEELKWELAQALIAYFSRTESSQDQMHPSKLLRLEASIQEVVDILTELKRKDRES